MILPTVFKTKNEISTNPLLDSVAQNYITTLLKEHGNLKVKDAIKGKFPEIKYANDGFDSSILGHSDKKQVVHILFDLDRGIVGKRLAAERLERLVLQVKNRLGADNAFVGVLPLLPEETFRRERIERLDRHDLEKKLFEAWENLEKAQEELETTVAGRTLELSAKKNMLEATLYNTSDGVYALDGNRKIVTFNNSMEKLTGYSLNDAEGRPADEVVRLFEDSMPLDSRVYCPVGNNTGQKNVYSNSKVTLVTRNGSKRYVKLVSAVIQEGDEVNLGCIVNLSDKTSETELEIMKVDFVSMAAHELRTPITSIRGYLAELNDDLVDLSEEHGEYLKRAIISADRLFILIENLLNISKIEKGTLTLQKKKTDWVELVKDVVESYLERAKKSGIELKLEEVNGKVPSVTVDDLRIREVLSNLLENAIKFNVTKGKVTVSIEVVDDSVITKINDTGCGIPPQSIPHIFKKFYKVAEARKSGDVGSGIGLFISSELIKKHNGKIWVESKLNSGSTFSFSLPLKDGN